MSSPKVFISSTYLDLVEIRDELSKFVTDYCFIPITFEKGDVTFQPNKTIEDSCYDEIKNCSFFILVIKEKFGAYSRTIKRKKSSKAVSVTQKEFYIARQEGIPIIVFIHQYSWDEYEIFCKTGKDLAFRFQYLENSQLACFIDEILTKDTSLTYIHRYQNVEDIINNLKKQWAGYFSKYLENEKKFNLRQNELIRVNPFKLFFFRKAKDISQKVLSEKSGINEKKIQLIEDAGIKKKRIEIQDFELLSYKEILSVSVVLNCSVGNIKGGLPDDFLSEYLEFYFKNKGAKQRFKDDKKSLSLFDTKAVVFDFDGTLTKTIDRLTTWEKIWIFLGYDVNECANLHRDFSMFKITHKEWCQLTEKYFKNKKLKATDLNTIADNIKLIDGTQEVIKNLYSKGIKLYICSGSMRYIIKRVLGELYQYFEEVKANEFIFDNQGYLKRIEGTKYDFEGKANFLRKVFDDNNIHSFETLYVGNSLNDEWANQSGAHTLCVNPSMTNPENTIYWTYSIRNMENLNEIYKYIKMKNFA